MNPVVVFLGLTLLPGFFIFIAVEILVLVRRIPIVKYLVDFCFYPIWILSRKLGIWGTLWMIWQLIVAAFIDYQVFCFLGISFVSHVSAAIIATIFFFAIRYTIASRDGRVIWCKHSY